jgi:ABC-type glycerol-3-phosphate transport system permease component
MKPEVAVRRWMLAPALLLFAAVALAPIVELVAMSVTRIDWIQGKANWTFVGLDQYARVFRDSLFRAGIFNTLLFSAGAILAAPLGIWFVQRWRRRHDRRPSRVASLFGAITASSLFTVLVWGTIFAFGPRATQQEFQSAVQQGQRQPPVKLPGWYTKMFPQTARADSASRKMLESPGFMKMALVLGAVTVVVFFGMLGGGMGWASYALLRVAWSGRGLG